MSKHMADLPPLTGVQLVQLGAPATAVSVQ